METAIGMELTESKHDLTTLLAAIGRIDSGNAKLFGGKMCDLIDSSCQHLVVDLSKVEFMTSAGFRSLLIAGKAASKANKKFALCGLSENLQRLFELGGFMDLFPIYPDCSSTLKNSAGV